MHVYFDPCMTCNSLSWYQACLAGVPFMGWFCTIWLIAAPCGCGVKSTPAHNRYNLASHLTFQLECVESVCLLYYALFRSRFLGRTLLLSCVHLTCRCLELMLCAILWLSCTPVGCTTPLESSPLLYVDSPDYVTRCTYWCCMSQVHHNDLWTDRWHMCITVSRCGMCF